MAEDASIDLGHYQRAIDLYKRDFVAWTTLYGAYAVVAFCTLGLGIVLGPNVFRATKEAIAEDRPPSLAPLFRTDRIVEDAIVVIGFFGASFAASWLIGPLSMAVSILVGLAPPIVSDDRYSGIDSLKLSFAKVMDEPMPCIVHSLVGFALALPAVCCLFPLPFVLPIGGIATWLFYLERRESIDVLAEQQNIRALPGP